MKVSLPLTPEQEETHLMNMIEAGVIFIDLTFPENPIPVMEITGMEVNTRIAIPQDIPLIKDFFNTLKLIEEGTAK